ncbi:hypothetical protein OROGR_026036 [Orobanche gracilis]
MLNKGFECLKGTGDVSIDVHVLEFSQKKGVRVETKEDPDATENSSSFADTISGNENNSGFSDAEVESQFFQDCDLALPFDGLGSVFPVRKKKLTAHWRDFIYPLMWRCKWTELRIKELESQSLKYAREISIHSRGKHIALDQTMVEQVGSKSLPFTRLSHGKKPMKRRKRKRVESITDIATYMSNHILFSERENKRGDLDGVPARENPGSSEAADAQSIPSARGSGEGSPRVKCRQTLDYSAFLQEAVSRNRTRDLKVTRQHLDRCAKDQHMTGHAEFGIHDDHVFPEDDNNNNYNFLEPIFRKIELVQGRVNKMKDKLDLVMTKNAVRFSSSKSLSQLIQTSSVRSPTFSACNGDTVSVGGSLYASPQHTTDYDIRDLMMPDSAVSSFGEATIPIPDIIESTVGLLSSIDVTQHHTDVGDSSERIVDNMLIQNERAGIEGSTLKNTEDAENSGEEESNNPMLSALALETAIVSKGVATTEQLVLKSSLSSEIHFPKNKRKRGERKAGSGNWTRQRPGEPDS